ncbi:MAG: citrate (Si)-synthase [Methanomassiliicoccus sp.]|nr:citrate (Si)-synthase [Methanomassiliicoccus sp.]
MATTANKGLRGIDAATTHISMVDGCAGKLYYRGYCIEELARESNFEEVAYLLIHGTLPNADQLAEFSEDLKRHRRLPSAFIAHLDMLPLDTPPMAILQAGTALLSGYDPDLYDESKEANQRKAMRAISLMPTMIAAWKRLKNNQGSVEPDDTLPHAANFLHMIKDRHPAEEAARFMDVAMILHAEHSFNASTFAARVVASTGADMYASLAAGIGALSGPLHGGANAQVMRNLLDTKDPELVEAWVEDQFVRGKRVSGMGHAVYKTIDPRARILQNMARSILTDHPEYRWYEMTERMALATQDVLMKKKGKKIYPNVDLYSASIYHAMGIHHDFFPAVFAMARSAGWCAHILEEKFPHPPVKPALYRPESTYVGPRRKSYVPIDER